MLAELPLEIVSGAVGIADLLVFVVAGFGQRTVDATAEDDGGEEAGLARRCV